MTNSEIKNKVASEMASEVGIPEIVMINMILQDAELKETFCERVNSILAKP
ncbi:hypothetical protein N9Y51_03915 [Alphaproteobacteria bacterium]|nr:hypothetical protein [Alphaproteobacteria bacterium]